MTNSIPTNTLLAPLFEPITLGTVEVRNRIVMTGHGTGMAKDYLPTVQHVAYYRERAMRGPSNAPCPIILEMPKEMETEDLDEIVEAHAIGARHAKLGGIRPPPNRDDLSEIYFSDRVACCRAFFRATSVTYRRASHLEAKQRKLRR